jgi:Tol biopolymer transport system component
VGRALYLLLLASCGRFDFDPVATRGEDATGSGAVDAAVTCGSWNSPSPIIFANTTFQDWEPTVAPNGGPIVFSSNRSGSNKLYVMPEAPTSPADITEITILNTGTDQWGPAWNATTTRLYFSRDNGTGTGLYSSSYDGTSFAAPQPEGGFAVADVVLGSAVSSNELELFYGDNNTTVSHLERATRTTIGDPWVVQGLVAALDSGVGDGWPTLSADGLTLVWESDRDPMSRLYTATRTSTTTTDFTNVRLFDGVPPVTGSADGDPDTTGGVAVFAFASTRPGGMGGGNDIWIARRDCH